jgi:glyoxylase-like metal-dependent hydrolase (beta-lactamase superfamily II)
MTATPTAFPAAGTFAVTQRITLLCDTPGATIHYTMDGSTPTRRSAVFDPYVLPVLEAINDGNTGIRSTYTIQAIAVADGHESAVARFDYVINRRDVDSYISTEVMPGLHMILDYDDTKMYLVVGTERAMLVDAGLGRGNLRAFVERIIGTMPLDVFITHGHPDHVAAMGQFEDAFDVYMSHHDLTMARSFKESMGFPLDLTAIIDVHEGMRFDLGGWVFDVYAVPGHSVGSMILFDASRGLVIAGDAFGSNRPSISDSLWMQFPGMLPIDTYLSSLLQVRAKLTGRIKIIYGGHNDIPMQGEGYLDTLQAAAQRLVDEGESVLVPSLRPIDKWQVVVGDRLTDPDWAAINVAKGSCLTTAHDQIATLALVRCGSSIIPIAPHIQLPTVPAGQTAHTLWLTPTASAATMRVDGQLVGAGRPFRIRTGQTVTVVVTATDQRTVISYQLSVSS